MFRSATFKLTMWYLALVMAISLIFSFVLYNVTTRELARGLNRETQRIYEQFPVFNNGRLLGPSPDIDAGNHRIFWRLAGFNLIVLVGAGFASYWLARRTLEPIEAAHEQQKRFTADVSHELRTPLTALKMESEVALMNQSLSARELRKTVASNLEEAAKLEAIINNLLRLTRLEAEELQQNFTTVELGELTRTAADRVAVIAKNRGIKLDSRATAAKFSGDHDSLVQLLTVLLDNAIKYSSKGQSVRLSAEAAKDQVIIRISDEGIGIDPIALERVFDRFYRADNSRTKQDTEGTGLGLSIAQLIAEVHHGDIQLKSQVGKGTTATVRLPKAQTTNTVAS